MKGNGHCASEQGKSEKIKLKSTLKSLVAGHAAVADIRIELILPYVQARKIHSQSNVWKTSMIAYYFFVSKANDSDCISTRCFSFTDIFILPPSKEACLTLYPLPGGSLPT